MTIYLMKEGKYIGKIAVVDIDQLHALISMHKSRVRLLHRVGVESSSGTDEESRKYDEEYLRRLGVPFKAVKLRRMVSKKKQRKPKRQKGDGVK